MPASLIEQDDRVCTWADFGCDFVEMELHGLAVIGGQHPNRSRICSCKIRQAPFDAQVLAPIL
jgi:hypothetical protein